MFDSYDRLNSDYIPHNSNDCKCATRIIYSPYFDDEVIDVWGKVVGYRYDFGQEIEINFDVDDYIFVEDNAIISNIAEEAPTENTVGEYGQYFYNVADLKLYKCVNFGQLYYNWQEQDAFSYPSNGTKKVVIRTNLSPIDVVIFNTRGEIVLTKTLLSDTKTLFISNEESSKIIPDLYKIVFITDFKIKQFIEIVIVDTRNSFNKDINHIVRQEEQPNMELN